MPTIRLNHFDCNYLYLESGHPETLVFSNSLGTNYSMWDQNVVFLSRHFNILRYDTRGHGKSSIEGETVTVAELGHDLIELLDYLRLQKVVFCGLSMGGLIGQWLGMHHAHRFTKIVLCNTAAKIGSIDGWNDRIGQVKNHGLSSILQATAERWFTREYRENHREAVEKILRDFKNTPTQGYTACCAMVRDADFTKTAARIEVPVLIICGAHDQVTTCSDGKFLQSQIPDADLITLEAAHLSNLPNPEAFAKHIIHFAKN